MTASANDEFRLSTEEELKDLLKDFSVKKPRVHVRSGLTGFSRNLDTLSWEELTEDEFQPIGQCNGSAVVVYRTHGGDTVGYGIFDETAYTIVVSEIITIILEIMPPEEESHENQKEQKRELKLLVNNMKRLVA
jgi:hypothetical protein